MAESRLNIDYTSKDYAGFRRLMLDEKREKMPEWTSESPNDFGVTLIELFAYLGDILSFYQDRIANEAFLATAVSRAGVVDIARMIDYRPTGTVAATVDVEVTSNGPVTIPAGTRISTAPVVSIENVEEPVFFETVDDAEFTLADGETQVVSCIEGTTITEELGESDGRIDQFFVLNQYPVIDRSVRILVNEQDPDDDELDVEWFPIDRLIEAGSTSNAFTTQEDSRGIITVFFGDNVNGRVPALGAKVQAIYRVGVGERGNTGPNTLTELHSEDPDVVERIVTLTNPEGATGGADQESADSIRKNAPQTLVALNRAVSLRDYQRIALEVSGIAKARAKQVAYNTVAVYVAPFAGGETASSLAKTEVADYLEDRKMSNITVLIEDPSFVAVDIEITLVVQDEYIRSQVADQVASAVTDLLDFEVVDFAYFFSLSSVYEATAAVEGVLYANVIVLDRDGGTGLNNIQFDDLEIPIAGAITINSSGGIIGT